MYRLTNARLKAEDYRIAIERLTLFPRDSLERSRGLTPSHTFESSFDLYDDPDNWESIVTGAGSTSTRDNDGSFYNLTVANTSGRVVRQTRVSMPSSVASARTIFVSLTPFVSAFSATNYTIRTGCFDNAADKISGRISGDGHFLQYAGGLWSVVRRSSAGTGGSQVDTVVNQSSWNCDKLDGTGPSAYTLSATAPMALVIEEGPTNTNGDCRMGVVIDGLTIWAHHFLPTGNRPALKTQRLPIRYEITCTGAGVTSSAASLYQIGCACFIDSPTESTRTFTRTTSARVFATDTPVLAIRAQAQSNRCRLRIRSITVRPLTVNDANRVLVRTIVNPSTLTGSSYTAVSSSGFEVDVAATAVSGGTEFNNGSYGCSIAGTPDVVVVVARALTGGALDCAVAIEWTES